LKHWQGLPILLDNEGSARPSGRARIETIASMVSLPMLA